MAIRSGDIVQLKSGGPRMTAGRKRSMNNIVDCYWFIDDELVRESFPVNALMKLPTGEADDE